MKNAHVVWDNLRSIVCVYKRSQTSLNTVRSTLLNSIITGLNKLECRAPTQRVKIEGNPLEHLRVSLDLDYADHPLVVGPRFQHDDLKCVYSNHLGYDTSGVVVFGLRDGAKTAMQIFHNKPTRTYRIGGRLGEATEENFAEQKVVERSSWSHVKAPHFSRLLATMQSAHQKEMFKEIGVDIQSQTAYELASQGLLRPSQTSKLMFVYGIKCVKFEPPDFSIELTCVNENEQMLKNKIFEIGYKLHSTAHCTAINCIRFSHFTLDNALLPKHWTIPDIMKNMKECDDILQQNKSILYQKSAVLQ